MEARSNDGARAWPALAASGWMVLFGLMSCAWGAGAMAGADTLGVEIERLARERDGAFVAELWGTGVLKLLAALLPLALAGHGPATVLPRRAVRIATAVVGGGCALYALANFVQHGLMQVGAIGVPDGLGGHAVPWHLALWDPFWLLGGMLFLTAAWEDRRAAARMG